MKTERVIVMMGGNLGDTVFLFEKAKLGIGRKIGSIIKESSLYRTEPWGTTIPLPFLNQAIEISTALSPQQTLSTLLSIEQDLGRQRSGLLNESRSIDLDILYFGDIILDQTDLKIPHPRLHQRRFVMEVLAEEWPYLIHPVLQMSSLEILKDLKDPLRVEKVKDGI
jgi:2-amino-4-hydroxy-6-hydroxymethyldihydropteridine diphosphokinase